MSTGFALPFGVTASIHTMTISRESSTADISSRANFLSPMSGIAREAGALLMGFFHRRVSIEYKGEADLVTEADRTSEALIRERIRKRWPEHDILGDPIVGRSRPLPMTWSPLILLSGHSRSQETKWCSVFHLLMSHPTSLRIVVAVMTSIPIRQAAPRAQDMTSRRVHYKNFVDELQKAKNRVKARVRAKVEHPFLILKRIFGSEKVRYRGIKKNHQRLCASFALVNLYLHRKRMAVARA